MHPALLIDFGSTYTKLTALDLDQERILGTSSACTTSADDIMKGLDKALALLEVQTGGSGLPDAACLFVGGRRPPHDGFRPGA